MYLCFKKILTSVFLVFILVPTPHGYFGLTAREALSINELLTAHKDDESSIYNLSKAKVCDTLYLPRQQKKMCRRGKGIAMTLVQALRLASMECAHQFSMERWNCTLAQYRQKLLRKGFKETSFLYAISSAGLVHAFASACSKGSLDRCTCDESKHLENTKAWMWGGCGHNIRFGLKFTRKFLKRARKSGKDIRAKIDEHNSHVGIKVVKDNVKTVCKCHGVSGSCTMKSCWRQLSSFHKIGTILKSKYEHAVKVGAYTNHATEKSRHKRLKGPSVSSEVLSARRGDLLYLDNSPSFCGSGRYSPGTSGRVCDKDNNCEVICCGRGYNVLHKQVQRSCQCQVIWCCKVNCKRCLHEEKIHMCK
ncbi:protein Wnt-9a-like [Haliotis rufescens]|uniref:protein Wnt-9a-like n=1 Tax=Haliotis rufescens TaxID=6454 RepID=UPI001EAFDFCF|nr:protein Wnt-9a-like [Haliotis rufescens]